MPPHRGDDVRRVTRGRIVHDLVTDVRPRHLVDGHLRAFATEDGRVVWDFDTARDYQTVNGVRAKGGSLDGAGPVIAGGMVFVNSGYARNGAMAGNVLLAFGPED